MDQDDDRLLLAAGCGDRPAMDELIRRHAPLVLAACRRQLALADADDAAQAVFIILWRRTAAVRGADRLPGWLVVTAQRVCSNARRSQRRRKSAERGAMTMTDDGPLFNEARAQLDEALAGLPSGEREVVVRRHLLGQDPAEIAAVLGCAEGTVHSRTSRGLERLRIWFTRRGIPCTTGVVTALCASERSAAQEIPAPALAACSGCSATAKALADLGRPIPIALIGAITMSLIALAIVAASSSFSAVAPAAVEPPLTMQRMYDVSELYGGEIVFWDPASERHVLSEKLPPPSDALDLTALERCRDRGTLCRLAQERAGPASDARLIDEGVSDEELSHGQPEAVAARYVNDVRRALAQGAGPVMPGLDVPRMLIVTADLDGQRRLAADLAAAKEVRRSSLLGQQRTMAAITDLLAIRRTHFNVQGGLNPQGRLPAAVPESVGPRFVVIWLPENRNPHRPIAVATDGSCCLLLTISGVHWRPGLRSAAAAQFLRRNLDNGTVTAPIGYDDWWRAAIASNRGSLEADAVYADLAERIGQAAELAAPGPAPAGF